MGYLSAFWSSSRWPSSRRQKLLARLNWYLQSSLKHITEWITGNKPYYRGGRYRQVSLYYIIHVLLHPTDIQLVTKLARETRTSVFFYRDKWQKLVLHKRLNTTVLSQCAEVSHRCTYKTSSMRHTNSIPAGIGLHVPWNTLSICLSAISLKHSIRLPWCLRPLHGYNLYSTPTMRPYLLSRRLKAQKLVSDFNYKMTHLPFWLHLIYPEAIQLLKLNFTLAWYSDPERAKNIMHTKTHGCF